MSYKDDVKLIKALADENRLEIIRMLRDGEKCGCIILEKLNITQPTLSHHMKILCDSGLVDSRKEGKWMHYSLSPEGNSRLQSMIGRYTISGADAVENKKCKKHKSVNDQQSQCS